MSRSKSTRTRAQESLTPAPPPTRRTDRARKRETIASSTKTGPEIQKTSVDGNEDGVIDVTVPSVSGMFIDLEKRGLRRELAGLVLKWVNLQRQLGKTNSELEQINNPLWQAAYSGRVDRQRTDFEAEVKKRAQRLELRKKKRLTEIAEVEDRIQEIAPGMKMPDLKATLPEVAPADQGNRDPDVSERDRLIRELARAGRSNHDICVGLDFELEQSGDAPSRGLPDHWLMEYGIRTYLAAYEDKRTKNSMQKMIWKAKSHVF
jgi:hypothetical protein